MTTTNWQAKGNDGSEASEVIDFGLVDASGRRVGARLFVQPNTRGEYVDGVWFSVALGSFSYSIQTTRNGALFGPLPRHTGKFATVAEAKAAAELAVERSRKAQARKYGTTVEESRAAKAVQSEKRREKVAAWLADYEARNAQPAVVAAPVAPVVEAAPVAVEAAPVATVSKLDAAHAFVEAEAARVLGRLRHVEPAVEAAPEAAPVDVDAARFRGYRDPDGALRFRRVNAAPSEPGALLPSGRVFLWPEWLLVAGRRMTVDEERQLWRELDASDPALAKARRAELAAWHATVARMIHGRPYTEPSSDAIARAEQAAGA